MSLASIGTFVSVFTSSGIILSTLLQDFLRNQDISRPKISLSTVV